MSKLPKGIRRRGDSFEVSVGSGKTRRTATAKTEEEARLVRARLLGKLEAGDVSREEPWSINRALSATLADVTDDGWGDADPKWRRIAEANVKEAIAFFGEGRKLDEITSDDLSAYIVHLRKAGNTGSTINRKLACLSKVWGRAVIGGGAKEKPRFKPLKRPEGEPRLGEIDETCEAECLRWLRAVGRDDHADAFTVLIDTGMRCGELWALERGDVDLRANMISVKGREREDGTRRTKGGGQRLVPMSPRVAEIMRARCANGAPFPFDNDWLRRTWDRLALAVDKLDDRTFTPHILRHTFAKRALRRGVLPTVVQKLLGHSDPSMTFRYMAALGTDVANAAALMFGQPQAAPAPEPPRLRVVSGGKA